MKSETPFSLGRNLRILAGSILAVILGTVVLGWLQLVAGRYDTWIVALRDGLLFLMTLVSLVLATLSLRRRRALQREIVKQQMIQEQFRQLAENIEAAFWLYDLVEEQLLYVSPGYQSLLGPSQDHEQTDWKTFLDQIHPGGHEYIARVAANGSAPEHANETFFRLYWPDGSMHWIHSRIFPVRTPNGDVYRLVGIAEDITERRLTEEELQKANTQLQEWAERLRQRNREVMRLSEMGKLLQACTSHEEAYEIVADSAAHIFSQSSGALFVDRRSQGVFENVADWNSPTSTEETFNGSECWALRHNESHVVPYSGLLCEHLREPPPDTYMCVPVLAQNGQVGVLHVQFTDVDADVSLETQERMAVAMAEQMALAIANLNLRKRLSTMAVRDPLTGLFNRRYMELSLENEIRRAAQRRKALGVIMLDLDHFKHFNDTYGHSVGDKLLRRLGAFLKANVRQDDIACRYGGEEFVLILPGASVDETCQRGEQLRQAFKQISLEHGNDSLSGITLSAGVAIYPNHGDTGETLLHAADVALYRAKAEGRDRLVLADSAE